MELNFRAYGAGQPLVILHGLFGSLNNWHSHAEALGSRFRVFAVDQRNHGGSPHADEMSYADMAEDLGEFLRNQRIVPASLLGHSMGGRTAMQFSLTHPSEVRKLVVVDIRPQGDPPRHTDILEAMQHVDFSAIHTRTDVDAVLAAQIPDSTVRQFLSMNVKRMPDGSYRWKLNLRAIVEAYQEIIGPVTAAGVYNGPALFLTGGRSSHVEESDHAGIRERFPQAQFVKIPAVGHWVHADAPGEFRRIVMEFLTQ